MENFEPTVCQHCGQTTTYSMRLDRGSARILLALFQAVARKGVNEIHPTQEVEWSKEEKWSASNVSRVRAHGLIAMIDGKPGYYALTRKAGAFMRGASIPKEVIVSKEKGHTIGYVDKEVRRVTFRELMTDDGIPYWDGDQQRMIRFLESGTTMPEYTNQQVLHFNNQKAYAH